MKAARLRLILTILSTLVAIGASPRVSARTSLSPLEVERPRFSGGVAGAALAPGPAEPVAPDEPVLAPLATPPVAGSPPPVVASPPPVVAAPVAAPAEAPWYERIKLRGYTQVRYNRLPSGVRNDDLINE